MNPYTWLVDSISCQRFARQVASNVESLEGGPFRWLHFWVHWFICPFCRQYWSELKKIGAEMKKLRTGTNHPIVKINEIKNRIRLEVKGGGQ